MREDGLGVALLRTAEGFRERPVLAYLISILAFLTALAIRFTLDGVLPAGFPYLTFFPAVLLTAFFCGTAQGSLVAFLSVLSAWYWFIPPAGSFALNSQSAIAVIFFVVILLADLVIIHVMRTAMRGERVERARTAALLEQQKTLFEELQHRTANNMAFIGALLAMHRRRVGGSAEAVSAFEDASARLDSMARIHRRLYDPTNIDLAIDAYFVDLLRDIFQSAGREAVSIDVRSDVGTLDVNRLITLSLIVSELAVNAIKHAFADGTGRFDVAFSRDGKDFVLSVRDDGPGFPVGFDPAKSDRLGYRVLSSFARTLDGSLNFHSQNGAITQLRFPA